MHESKSGLRLCINCAFLDAGWNEDVSASESFAAFQLYVKLWGKIQKKQVYLSLSLSLSLTHKFIIKPFLPFIYTLPINTRRHLLIKKLHSPILPVFPCLKRFTLPLKNYTSGEFVLYVITLPKQIKDSISCASDGHNIHVSYQISEIKIVNQIFYGSSSHH